MRKGLVAVAGAVAIVAALAAAVPILEEHAAGQIKAQIEHDGTAKVGKVEVGLLVRRIALVDLKSANAGAELSIGRWEASGLAWPLGELLQGRTPLAGFRWGDPLQATRLELEDVQLTGGAGGGRWTLQSLVVDGFDLARFDGAYDGSFPFQVLTARALGALTMRRLDERNFLVTLPGTGDTFGAAEVVVERYERGRIASLAFSNFEAAARDDTAPLFKFAEIRAGGIDASRLIAGLSAAKWYPGAPTGRLRIDDASISGFSGEMLDRYGISLGSISLETVRESDKLSRSRSRIEGFVMAPPLRGVQGLQARIALQSMGLKELKLDLDCTGTEDRAKGELAFGPCALVGPGLAEIDLSGRIVQTDPAFWRAIDDGDVMALNGSRAALGAARLVFADKSLLERGLKALSTVTGRSLAETRSNLAREIRLYQPPDVLISEDMTKLLDTVARFVERGGTLTIEARPEPPLGIEGLWSLGKPGADLVRLLGLSASLSR